MNFYNFITDPTNNVKVNINSATAKKVIENYINYINTHSQQFGGSGDDAPPSYDSLFGPATASLTAQELRLAEEAEDAARVTQEEVKRAKEAVEVQRAAEEAVRLAKAGRLAKEAAETARAAEEAARAAEEAERASEVALAAEEEARRLEEERSAQIKATELAIEETKRKEEERRADEEIAELIADLAKVENETLTLQARKDQNELVIKNAKAEAKAKQTTENINVDVLRLKGILSAGKARLEAALPAEEVEFACVICQEDDCPPSKAFIITAPTSGGGDDGTCLCFRCIGEYMFTPGTGDYVSESRPSYEYEYDKHPPLTRVSLKGLYVGGFIDKRVWTKFWFDGGAGNPASERRCGRGGCRRKAYTVDEEEELEIVEPDFYIDATSLTFLSGLGGNRLNLAEHGVDILITEHISTYRANKYQYQQDKSAELQTTQSSTHAQRGAVEEEVGKLELEQAELKKQLGVDTAFGKFKNFLGMG